MKGMKIYVAGALSSKEDTNRNPSKVVTDYIRNMTDMLRAAVALRKKGHYPYIPGMDFLLGLIAGDWEEDDYRGLGMAFLEVCDAIVVISYSWGVREELKRAKELGLKAYQGIGEVPNVW